MYTTGDLSLKLKCSRQTISNWCAEFTAFLSVTANPEAGGHRRFTDDDLSVLMLVADMKNRGSTYEDIHASLKAGQRAELVLGDMSLATVQSSEIVAFRERVARLEDEIERLENENSRLKPFEQLAAVEKALKERAEKELAEKETLIRQLYRDLGRLEGRG